MTQEEPVPVWPFEQCSKRGYAFLPLYKKAPQAALKNGERYRLLALVDALRDGSARERELAKRELFRSTQKLSSQSNRQLPAAMAERLKRVLSESVFAGGCKPGRLIIDPAACAQETMLK